MITLLSTFQVQINEMSLLYPKKNRVKFTRIVFITITAIKQKYKRTMMPTSNLQNEGSDSCAPRSYRLCAATF